MGSSVLKTNKFKLLELIQTLTIMDRGVLPISGVYKGIWDSNPSLNIFTKFVQQIY